MEPRLSFVTLGVADVERARAFYEALGFRASAASNPGVAFFDAGGVVLALFGRSALARDAKVKDSVPGFPGLALAHNVGSEAAVDATLAEAVRAGARLRRRGQKTFWGGYSGYFADPDGHLWEVAYNPFMPLDAAGRVALPPPLDHDSYSDAYIRGALGAGRVIALIGASSKPERASNEVMEFLVAHGYKVRPVNPLETAKRIHGAKVYRSLADVPAPVDIVDVFRASDAVPEIVDEVLAERKRLKVKVLWLQIGVRHDEAARRAGTAGLKVVMDRCPKREIKRLKIKPFGA